MGVQADKMRAKGRDIAVEERQGMCTRAQWTVCSSVDMHNPHMFRIRKAMFIVPGGWCMMQCQSAECAVRTQS